MVASPIVPLGWGFSRGSVGAIRSCAEDVDGVVVSFKPAPAAVAMEVVDTAAVGACVDGSLVSRECRPVLGDSGRLAPSSSRSRSRFLGLSDIAGLSSAGNVDGQDCPSS